MSKVAVIIPTYKAHDTIKRTLASIYTQTVLKDINVYVVVDGEEEGSYDYLLGIFNRLLDIQIIYGKENKGPGIARQLGINNSKEPYITFIDADDTFESAYAIEKMLFYMELDPTIVRLISTFYEETANKQTVAHTNDHVWMHGKMFRRTFLNTHKIRFNNTRACEDVGFNRKIDMLENKQERTQEIQEVTYHWMYRHNSIVRQEDNSYTYREAIIGLADNITDVYNFMVKKGIMKNPTLKHIHLKVHRLLVDQFASMWIMYNHTLYIKKEYAEEVLKSIRKFYKNTYKKIPKEFIKLYETSIVTHKQNEHDLSRVEISLTFKQFKEMILNE